jgi:cytochrome c peroxidase
MVVSLVIGAAGTSYAIIQIQFSNMVGTVEGANLANTGGAPFFKSAGAHVSQTALRSALQANPLTGMISAFTAGDRLFGLDFNEADGSGASVDGKQRFTRMPRADLTGQGMWATHTPARATGPNTQSCAGCHNQPSQDGAGSATANVHRDPLHSANPKQMIQRNTPHLFGGAARQLLAEETTTDLQNQRDAACNCRSATNPACTQSVNLSSKGVTFGSIFVSRSANQPCAFNTAHLQGVATDLVVRPFQWKGAVTHLRAFARDAAHNEIGMQANEFYPNADVDTVSDHDGDFVGNELTVGDMTALATYGANQPRPTTRQELVSLGLLDCSTNPCSDGQPPPNSAAITAGSQAFGTMGCANCHMPQLIVNNPVWQEPSRLAVFRENGVTPGGQTFASLGVDLTVPVTVNILSQIQENSDVTQANGQGLGNFESDGSGHAIVRLYGDLKRHYMGTGLTEQIDEIGSGAGTFLTANLWGVGSTAPYMHDGRSPTLTGAILEHGSAGADNAAVNAFNAFNNAANSTRQNLILFLMNLVLFKSG